MSNRDLNSTRPQFPQVRNEIPLVYDYSYSGNLKLDATLIF